MKYHCIYNEYGEFYNSLNQVHPEVRDLTKTATFKKWKKDQQSNEADEQESEQQQTDLPGQVDDQESEQQQQQQIDLPGQVDDQESEQQQQQIDLPGQVDEQESELDILSLAAEEILPIDPVNVNEVDNIINEIISDLEQDNAMQDILNEYHVNVMNNQLVQPQYQEEDEGIGLNLETELEDILELFDYELEVEGFEF